MSYRAYKWLCIAFGAFVLILAMNAKGCKRSPDPTATTKPASPLIVNVSGLGNSAGSPLDPLVNMQRITFPDAQIAYLPTNGWQTNIGDYIRKSQYSKLVLIGHSFGGDHSARAATALGTEGKPVDLLILIDPVAYGAGNDTVTVPQNVVRCIVFRRKSEGAGIVGMARRANINGKVEITNLDLGHSAIASDNAVLVAVQDAIREATK